MFSPLLQANPRCCRAHGQPPPTLSPGARDPTGHVGDVKARKHAKKELSKVGVCELLQHGRSARALQRQQAAVVVHLHGNLLAGSLRVWSVGCQQADALQVSEGAACSTPLPGDEGSGIIRGQHTHAARPRPHPHTHTHTHTFAAARCLPM